MVSIVIPAQAGIQTSIELDTSLTSDNVWISASAKMTGKGVSVLS